MDDLRERKGNLTEEQIAEFRNAEALGSPERSKPHSESQFSKHSEMSSPPGKLMFIDAEGLQKTLQGLTNMALAHEIALNKDFQLKKPDRVSEPVSQQVQEALDAKEKYWETVDTILLRKDIKECKITVMDLIHTLKTMLHSTMLPHNVKMREKTDQELDLEKVSKQIDNDAFDFVHYMDFILDSLAALCCPIRDQEIVEIRNIEVPSRQVRKTIDLMENMNLDMANFIISQSRSHIVQNCVTYERNKFASFVDMQYRMGNDPIKVTRDWILRHATDQRSLNETMGHAFLEILDWDDKPWPESLALDWKRFSPIRDEVHRVTIVGAMVVSVFDYARALLMDSPDENSSTNDFDKGQASVQKSFRLLTKLREELNLLITCEELRDTKKFEEALERCCMQAIKVVDSQCNGITSTQKDNINAMIRPLVDLNHPVRVLYYRRVKEWFIELAKQEGKGKILIPQNLSMVGPLIIGPITEMLRLVMYNRGVFDILYTEIHDGNCPPPTFYPTSPVEVQEGENSAQNHVKMDASIVHLLTKLQGVPDKNMNANHETSETPNETLFTYMPGSFEPSGSPENK